MFASHRLFRRAAAAAAGCGAAGGAAYFCHHGPAFAAPQIGDVSMASIPAHLQNAQRRFKYYADGKDAKGQPVMSSAAFLRSSLGVDKGEPVSQDSVALLEARFKQWGETAGSKVGLTYDAFCTYQMLVQCSESDAQCIFTMYDDNETATLNAGQFQELLDNMAQHVDKTAEFTMTSGFSQRHFGKDHHKEMSLEAWENDLSALKGEVWLSTFAHFDKTNSGCVTPSDFMTAALSSIGVTGIAANRRIQVSLSSKSAPDFQLEDEYDAASWVAFKKVLNNRHRLERAMMLSRGRFPLSPNKFYDCLRACDMSVSKEQSNIIFAIFDKNGDRDLSYQELSSTLNMFRRATSGN